MPLDTIGGGVLSLYSIGLPEMPLRSRYENSQKNFASDQQTTHNRIV